MQPFFPIFHLRPPAGHVNDPNGPFRDPATGFIHLFMQYCPRGPCHGQSEPAHNETRNYQSATHFYSQDGGATWLWTGNSSGVIAACDPLRPGKCPPSEADDDCPDDLGVYSGSTTMVGGVPHYAYPGVHTYSYHGTAAVTMSQCFATPEDPSDPALSRWKKRTFIRQAQIPHGVSQHFHDDTEMFKVDGSDRWYILLGSAACGGQPSGDCPHPDPSVPAARGHGVNYLFSTAGPGVEGAWRAEHSLFNTSGFVSCPELYRLPGMGRDRYVYHAMNQPNVFGRLDARRMLFMPDNRSEGMYDFGDGHASKSYWDEKTQRRIMWSWIAGSFPCSNPQGLPCDSMQSVPRAMEYDASLDSLIINPIEELAKLRTSQLSSQVVRLSTVPRVLAGASAAAIDIEATFVCGAASRSTCGAALWVRASVDLSDRLEVPFECVVGGGCEFWTRAAGGSKPSRRVRVPFATSAPFTGSFTLRVLVDTCVIEIYAMGGRAVFTAMHIPADAASTAVALVGGSADGTTHGSGSSVQAIANVSVWGMGSAYA